MAVDLCDEQIAWEVSNRSSKNKESKSHNQRISKIEEFGNKISEVKRFVEVDYIKEHVECRRSRSKERSPPPMIILMSISVQTIQNQK